MCQCLFNWESIFISINIFFSKLEVRVDTCGTEDSWSSSAIALLWQLFIPSKFWLQSKNNASLLMGISFLALSIAGFPSKIVFQGLYILNGNRNSSWYFWTSNCFIFCSEFWWKSLISSCFMLFWLDFNWLFLREYLSIISSFSSPKQK